MKLSEAILEGSKHTQPTHFVWYHPTRTPYGKEVVYACALGTAACGYAHLQRGDFHLGKDVTYTELESLFPVLKQRVQLDATHNTKILDHIIHLNDGKQWSRERIAQWIKEVYEQDDVQTVS